MSFMDNDTQKIRNIVRNPDNQFFLHATPELKRAIVANEHPFIKKFNVTAKAQLLEDKAIVLDNDDVLAFIEKRLTEEGTYLFSLGSIRVVGSSSIQIQNKGT